MIDKLPIKLISKERLNDWSLYNLKLEKYNNIKKYLSEKLKFWVENLNNPLEVRIIYNLFLDKLNYLEDSLLRLEENLGEEDLARMCDELEINTPLPYQINKKFISLDGEIVVFSELKKEYHKVTKIKVFGDWETENKIISVKTLTGLDYNYKNIENAIKCLTVIEENEILRDKFNDIGISKAESLNYNLLERVLDFIREDMVKFLEYLSIIYMKFSEIGEQAEYQYKNLKIFIDVFEQHGKRTINFDFAALDKFKEDSTSTLKISFVEKDSIVENIFAVSYDVNSYWMGEKLNIDVIANRIQEKINEVNIPKSINKKFELWIVLYLHDKHSHFIINNIGELKAELRDKIDFKELNVYLLIVPELVFDLKQNVKIKLD